VANLEKLKVAQPLYQQVYERIKESILTGEYEPNEKIVVSKLEKKYKISRTPLREALRQLEIEGLLVQGYSGLHVVELNTQDFTELYQSRLLLEKEVMRSITDTITEEELQEIGNLLDESDRLLERSEYLKLLELNTKFHDQLLESSPNKRMADLLKQVRSFLLIYRARILRNDQYNIEINQEHRRIYETLVKRDANLVVNRIETHIKNDQERGVEAIKE
jgi:DNA-binding GntR family transcriptional regulator